MFRKIWFFLQDYKEEIWKGGKVFSAMALLILGFFYLPRFVRWADESRFERVCKAVVTSNQEFRNRVDGSRGSYMRTTALQIEYDYLWDGKVIHGGDILPVGAVSKKQFNDLRGKIEGDTLFVLCTGAKNKIKMD